MKKYWLTVFALAAALAWAAPVVAQGKGNPHDRGKEADDGKWEARNGYEYRSFGPGEQPPGWSQGKKTGWGNCGMPPGQAKKYGCRSYVYNGRTHYYYRDEQGRTFVRRPAAQHHDEHEHGEGHH